MRFFLISIFLFVSVLVFAQTPVRKDSVPTLSNDSIKKAKELHKSTYSMPRRVTLMSAIVPGLGQVYNKHYWKVPVIYAGIGSFTYMFITNNREYNYYRNNLRAIYDDDSTTNNVTGYSDDNVQLQKVTYRKRRDLAVIGIAVIYLINVVDANVSAHLKTFDVSDDLSLNIAPHQEFFPKRGGGFGVSTGLSIKLNFR